MDSRNTENTFSMPESAFDDRYLIAAGCQNFRIVNGIPRHGPCRVEIRFRQIGIDTFSVLRNHKAVSQPGQLVFQMGHFITVPNPGLAVIHFRAVPPVVFPQLLLIVVNHALGKLDAVFIAVHIHKSMPVAAQRGVQTHDQYDYGKQNRYQNHHDIG